MKNIFPFILAAGSGALMAVQGSLNSLLSKYWGLFGGTFVIHTIGMITAAILLLFTHDNFGSNIKEIPWFAWLGGVLGVGIIIGVAGGFSKLGAGTATTAIVATQLLFAYLIEQFGWLGMNQADFNLWKLFGIALIVGGTKILI